MEDRSWLENQGTSQHGPFKIQGHNMTHGFMARRDHGGFDPEFLRQEFRRLNQNNKMTRQDIYKIIDGERDYQDLMEQNPDSHVVSDFPLSAAILAIEKIIGDARHSWYYDKDPYPVTMEYIRKIAGVAVKIGEKYGLSERKIENEQIK